MFLKAKELSILTGTRVGLMILNKDNKMSTYFTDGILKDKIESQLQNIFKLDQIKNYENSKQSKENENVSDVDFEDLDEDDS